MVDIDDKRLAQVQKLLPVELAASKGIELVYVNTKGMSDPVQTLRALTDDAGFDDVFVYAAVPSVVEMADELLAEDGCLNFFAGPTDKNSKCRLISTTSITTVRTLSARPAVPRTT